MQAAKLSYRYLKYILNAVDEHSLHGPFVFDFYTNVIKPSETTGSDAVFLPIEKLRKSLLQSDEVLKIYDLGAGSKIDSNNKRKVKDIAKNSLSTRKFSRFLYRLIRHYKLKHVLELGTSLGINTLYMATAGNAIQVTTMEGCPATGAEARKNFVANQNINLVTGDINTTLPGYISTCNALDLVYFDANHEYKPTIEYFDACLKKIKPSSIFVFDDIHWSNEMEMAWTTIKNHPLVTLSVDIFDAGIIFFKKGLQKQHYILEF